MSTAAGMACGWSPAPRKARVPPAGAYGRATRFLARCGASVTAVDLSTTLIARARAIEAHEPLGIEYLVGNGWEWTSTVFAPFDGFEPMASYPEYSADFFDGRHFVIKGASPATARELIRPSFRNWFRGNYPYVYAKFRTVL